MRSAPRTACRRARFAWLGAAWAFAAPALAAGHWNGALAATSDYVFRGVSQSDHGAALQADLHLRSPFNWFVGAWLSSIDPSPGFGDYELNLYAGHSWVAGERWVISARYVRYLYPDSPAGRRYDADELSLSLEFEDRCTLTISGSPNATRYSSQGLAYRRSARSYEASLRQPLVHDVSAIASFGYYDTHALFGASYRAWSAGLALRAAGVDFALSRFGADAAARRLFGAAGADGRWVASAVWPF